MAREGLGAEIQPMGLSDREHKPNQLRQKQAGQCEKQEKRLVGQW